MQCICTTPNVEPRSAASVGKCEVDSLTYRDDLTNVDSVCFQKTPLCYLQLVMFS